MRPGPGKMLWVDQKDTIPEKGDEKIPDEALRYGRTCLIPRGVSSAWDGGWRLLCVQLIPAG